MPDAAAVTTIVEPEHCGGTQARHCETAVQALRFIQQHLTKPIGLDDLVNHTGVSRSQLAAVFSGKVGESVYNYIRRLRLERGAAMLISSRANVTDIALACGFDSHEAFTRAFRSAYSVTPSRYRKLPRPSVYLASPTQTHHDTPLSPGSFTPIADRSAELTVTDVTLPAQRVAYMRHLVPPDQRVVYAWIKMLAWATLTRRLPREGQAWGMYYDDPRVTVDGRVRYDTCIPLAESDEFHGSGAVGVMNIPAGRYAALTVNGSMDEHFRQWEVFAYQWVPAQQRVWTEAFALDRYELPPGSLLRPWRLLRAVRRGFSATYFLPVVRGQEGRLPRW